MKRGINLCGAFICICLAVPCNAHVDQTNPPSDQPSSSDRNIMPTLQKFETEIGLLEALFNNTTEWEDRQTYAIAFIKKIDATIHRLMQIQQEYSFSSYEYKSIETFIKTLRKKRLQFFQQHQEYLT